MEIIKPGQYVEATYDLYVGENNEQELMEKATKENPLKFVFGTDQMLPAFEEKLKGLKAGDKFDFIIPCNDAYGEYDKDHVLELGKEIFEVNGVFDKDMIYEGNTVPMMDSNGNRLNGSVLEVKEDIVVMDFNHPLAGEDLHFIGSIELVREDTHEELHPTCGSCEGCNCNHSDCDSSNCH